LLILVYDEIVLKFDTFDKYGTLGNFYIVILLIAHKICILFIYQKRHIHF
jgi:hypothetical protein